MFLRRSWRRIRSSWATPRPRCGFLLADEEEEEEAFGFFLGFGFGAREVGLGSGGAGSRGRGGVGSSVWAGEVEEG